MKPLVFKLVLLIISIGLGAFSIISAIIGNWFLAFWGLFFAELVGNFSEDGTIRRLIKS